jgi:hypothetical protein
MAQENTRYPRIAELGVTVHTMPVTHVKSKELDKALGKRKKQFDRLFGCQTMLIDGPYAWDVEAVLERMATGRLTGTQADLD